MQAVVNPLRKPLVVLPLVLVLFVAGCERKMKSPSDHTSSGGAPMSRAAILDPQQTIRTADKALQARDYAKARSLYLEVADVWARDRHFLKAVVVYRYAFELQMIDEVVPRKVAALYRILGLIDDAEAWENYAAQASRLAKQWPLKEAVVYSARLDWGNGNRGSLRYGNIEQPMAEVERVSDVVVRCSTSSKFAGLPEPMLLAFLRTTLKFRPVDHEVSEDDDRYEPIRVTFSDSRRGYSLREGGGWELAKEQQQATPVQQPTASEADRLAAEGDVFMKFGLTDKAIASYKAALRLEPGHRSATTGLAHVRGEAPQAAPKPEDADTLVQLGDLYLEMGLTDDAIKAYSDALKANPRHKAAQEKLQKARGK